MNTPTGSQAVSHLDPISSCLQAQQPWTTTLASARWLALACCLALSCVLAGCQNSKNSLYEEIDHQTPAHWPSDMADAAGKIRSRLTTLASQADNAAARSELMDLVSWCGEVAADTDITEQQWQPIYDQAEAIRLRVNAGAAIETFAAELQQLCSLLEAAHQAIQNQPTL